MTPPMYLKFAVEGGGQGFLRFEDFAAAVPRYEVRQGCGKIPLEVGATIYTTIPAKSGGCVTFDTTDTVSTFDATLEALRDLREGFAQ